MAKKPLSPEARSILNSRISRRTVFAGVGAVAGASALAS
jgi:spermidine/putrescine transport system substrate-binding protein